MCDNDFVQRLCSKQRKLLLFLGSTHHIPWDTCHVIAPAMTCHIDLRITHLQKKWIVIVVDK